MEFTLYPLEGGIKGKAEYPLEGGVSKGTLNTLWRGGGIKGPFDRGVSKGSRIFKNFMNFHIYGGRMSWWNLHSTLWRGGGIKGEAV